MFEIADEHTYNFDMQQKTQLTHNYNIYHDENNLTYYILDLDLIFDI